MIVNLNIIFIHLFASSAIIMIVNLNIIFPLLILIQILAVLRQQPRVVAEHVLVHFILNGIFNH